MTSVDDGFAPAPSDDPRVALMAAQDQIVQLQSALISARRIGVAIGIVMTRQNATYDQAFELLVKASQVLNHKVRDLAERVMYEGALPTLPQPGSTSR